MYPRYDVARRVVVFSLTTDEGAAIYAAVTAAGLVDAFGCADTPDALVACYLAHRDRIHAAARNVARGGQSVIVPAGSL